MVNASYDQFNAAATILGNSKFVVTNFSTYVAGEVNTLELMHDVCSRSNDGCALYLHGKGVSRVGDANVQSWIDYMEYFVIDNWKLCVEKLTTHDTCGVNLQTTPGKHYSGNFWWSNINYLQKLPRFSINNSGVMYHHRNPRAYCEFWLLDNNFCNPCTLHNSGICHYSSTYNKINYTL